MIFCYHKHTGRGSEQLIGIGCLEPRLPSAWEGGPLAFQRLPMSSFQQALFLHDAPLGHIIPTSNDTSFLDNLEPGAIVIGFVPTYLRYIFILSHNLIELSFDARCERRREALLAQGMNLNRMFWSQIKVDVPSAASAKSLQISPYWEVAKFC